MSGRFRFGTGLRRRNCCRVASLVLLPIGALLSWQGIDALGRITWSYRFDPTNTLSITVRSCDVAVRPCTDCTTEGYLRVTQPLIGAGQVVQYVYGSSHVDDASFESTVACDGIALSCANRCQVDIHAPPDMHRLQIQQALGDTAARVAIRVYPGVSIATLTAKGHAAQVIVSEAVVSSLLEVSSGLEATLLIDSTVAVARLAAASNNVYVVTPNASLAHGPATIDYRSASNYGCFATTGSALQFESPWSLCELATEPWTPSAVALRTR